MAASSKKLKGSRDGEKKQGTKKIEEEVIRIEERKEEVVIETEPATPSAEPQVAATPPPEPVYEEPILTQLIVERSDIDCNGYDLN